MNDQLIFKKGLGTLKLLHRHFGNEFQSQLVLLRFNEHIVVCVNFYTVS